MKEIDFNGFVLYKVYDNGNIVVNHVLKSNDLSSYIEIVNLVYVKWGRKKNNVVDILLLPLPFVDGYNLDNPIFRASSIGTDKEFDRDKFRTEYYGKI